MTKPFSTRARRCHPLAFVGIRQTQRLGAAIEITKRRFRKCRGKSEKEEIWSETGTLTDIED